MPAPRSLSLSLGSLLGVVLGACFVGEATIGAICEDASKCGVDQSCTNSVCGMCGDGKVQAGEVCFGAASEELAFGEVTELVAIDVDHDGTKELLAVVNEDCDGMPCWNLNLLYDDAGDFESFPIFDPSQPGRVPDITFGNFDGNATPDVVAAVQSMNPRLSIFYDFPMYMPVDVPVSLFPRAIEVGDFNGDGLDDVLVGLVDADENEALVMVRSLGTSFDTEMPIITDVAPRLAAPVDMDHDGDLDLVVASAVFGTVGVDLNDGTGVFAQQPRVSYEFYSLLAAKTADFDLDDQTDVVVTGISESAGMVGVLRGRGDGSLERYGELTGSELPIDVLAQDITHDGAPDLLVVDFLEDKLPFFINRDGGFPDQVGIDVGAASATILREDFNADGVPDLVLGNANGVITVVEWEE